MAIYFYHPVLGPFDPTERKGSSLIHRLAQTKVGQFNKHRLSYRDHDVLWFDVSMDEVHRVNVLQTLSHLQEDFLVRR